MKLFMQRTERPTGAKRSITLALLLACGVAFAARRPAVWLVPVAAAQPKISSQTAPGSSPEFIRAADEVLAQMSKILDLPIKEPLKKTLRSKQEVRDYLIREDKEDKNDAERYADDKTLEAFGLIPKGFPLDSFMLDVLTDQVAGLYDPKAKEFYIADWIPADEQRTVMSHELTHALEDQSFHIDSWIKAARPNDDAELARDAVSEGSAMAAMVDYEMLDQKVSVRDVPDVTLLIRASALSEMDKDPNLAKAPLYIRDELLFPYLAGTGFIQQFLKAHTGWQDLHLIFQDPPVSTQQILKQLLDENRAELLSPGWKGDRYAVFEDAKTKSTPLVFRLALDNPDDAAHFFGQYSEALEHKYKTRTDLFRRPNFFQFQSESG